MDVMSDPLCSWRYSEPPLNVGLRLGVRGSVIGLLSPEPRPRYQRQIQTQHVRPKPADFHADQDADVEHRAEDQEDLPSPAKQEISRSHVLLPQVRQSVPGD